VGGSEGEYCSATNGDIRVIRPINEKIDDLLGQFYRSAQCVDGCNTDLGAGPRILGGSANGSQGALGQNRYASQYIYCCLTVSVSDR
jgi:hypothetical protein